MNAITVWCRLNALAALIGVRVDELLAMPAAEVARRRNAKLGLRC